MSISLLRSYLDRQRNTVTDEKTIVKLRDKMTKFVIPADKTPALALTAFQKMAKSVRCIVELVVFDGIHSFNIVYKVLRKYTS